MITSPDPVIDRSLRDHADAGQPGRLAGIHSSPPVLKFKRNLRDFGIGRTLLKSFSVICSPLFQMRTYRLYRAELSRVSLPPQPDPAFVFRLIEPHERGLVRQIIQMEEWLRHILEQPQWLDSLCLVALDKGQVAGFNLVNFTRMNLPVVHYQRALRRGDAFSDQITVNKAFRGRGLGSTLRYELFRLLRQQGKRRVYGGTDVHNEANLALCRKVGLLGVADIRYMKAFGWEKTVVTRMDK